MTKLLAPFMGLVAGVFVTGLTIGGALMVFSVRNAVALPAYSQQTGKVCGQCHVAREGGGALTPFGQAFKDNGHKLPPFNKPK